MLVHERGVTRRHSDFVNIHERVLKDEVMMRFLRDRHPGQRGDGHEVLGPQLRQALEKPNKLTGRINLLDRFISLVRFMFESLADKERAQQSGNPDS